MAARDIVVVDDEPEVCAAMLGMLEAAGYTAVAFTNPAGALARIGEMPPGLVLLDMLMPGIDGARFLDRLRVLREGDPIPVIVVSAVGELLKAMKEDDRRMLGVRAVLSKPVSYQVLVRHVREVLGPAPA